MKNKNTTTKGCAAAAGNQRFRNKKANCETKNQITQATISNPPMTEQIVVPPSRVWNKIESILNQQDQAKASINAATVFSISTAIKAGKKKHPLYFTTFGISVLLCFVFIAL